MDVNDLHLADLHLRARELGVPRYRMLTRDQLIAAIEEEGPPAPEETNAEEEPRPGERPRALVRVTAVNGLAPEEERSHFDDLTPAPPHRRLLPPDAPGDPLVRSVDLLGPLAFGQRVLILAQPRSGRTTLLRAIGVAVLGEKNPPSVLLAGGTPR